MTGKHLLAIVLATATPTACRGNNPEYGKTFQVAVGGDARSGQRVIVEKNCGSCHTIPGISGADGLVGPPLYWFSRRTYIAGELPNTPENLAHWVQSPTSIEPATAMPALGLTAGARRRQLSLHAEVNT